MTDVLPIAARWAGPIATDDDGELRLLAVRDDEAYDALRARLPAHRVQQRQPAPPSDDPLRARPLVDFGAQMLVVVVRGGSLAPVTIAQVERAAHSVVVHVAVAPAPPEARPFGVGVYAAVLVPRAEGALELRVPRVITDARDVDGAVGTLVTLHGPLARTRIATILGVDVGEGSADPGHPAEATGWLERDVVARAELDALIAERGPVAHRGAGTFHRLIAPEGAGLAPAHRRW